MRVRVFEKFVGDRTVSLRVQPRPYEPSARLPIASSRSLFRKIKEKHMFKAFSELKSGVAALLRLLSFSLRPVKTIDVGT